MSLKPQGRGPHRDGTANELAVGTRPLYTPVKVWPLFTALLPRRTAGGASLRAIALPRLALNTTELAVTRTGRQFLNESTPSEAGSWVSFKG